MVKKQNVQTDLGYCPNCIVTLGIVLQLRQLGWAGIVLQEGFVLQRMRLRDYIVGHQGVLQYRACRLDSQGSVLQYT